MKYRNWTSWILAALVTPVFMGCSQGAEEPAERAGQALEPAAQPRAHEGRRGFRADPAKLLERLDENGDGALQATELPERKRAQLLGADADSDGKLTAAELGAHMDKKHRERFGARDANRDGFWDAQELGRRWSRLSAADADRDGRVSFAELETAMKEGKLGFGRGHRRGFPHKDPAAMLKRFDANADGKLQLSELPEHKRDKLGAADANGDGLLGAEELKAFFEARRRARPSPARGGGTTL